MRTLQDALIWGTKELQIATVEGPRLDAEVLLLHATGLNRAGLYRDFDLSIKDGVWQRFRELIFRRVQGEPVAYIVGHKEFFSLEFNVNQYTLIPRPETELLVESVIENVRQKPFTLEGFKIIDVGTGSGAIAVSLAYNLPESRLWAVDISSEALTTAKINATSHGVDGQIAFVQGDLLANLRDCPLGEIDWVVANLPYVPSGDISDLQVEVAKYEPHTALDGGLDGLDLYRRLIPQAEKVLKTGGWIGMEMTMYQGTDLRSLLPADKWTGKRILRDFAGLDRFVLAQKR